MDERRSAEETAFVNPEAHLARLVERGCVSEQWWRDRYAEAQLLTESRRDAPSVFLVAAAHHPLIEGIEPGPAFSATLNAARNRGLELSGTGIPVEIYVPGSRHRHQGVDDFISLSQAGVSWLWGADLPDDITVHGENINAYKGEAGVYNGGDEAFAAASYFKDMKTLRHMEVFCTATQRDRWDLQALAHGVDAVVHAVEVLGGEPTKFGRLLYNYAHYVDPTWQSPHSFMGRLTRRQRRPKS